MSLELLEHVSDLFPDTSLEGMRLLGGQHLLGSNADMLEHLFRRHSLKPEETHLIGKCYSTHEGTAGRLVNQGVRIHPFSTKFYPRCSFDRYYQVGCRGLVESVLRENYQTPTVIIDDGGSVVAKTVQGGFHHRRNLSVVVEQTSSGFRKNEQIVSALPFINIARSEAKLILESPFIAEKIVEEFRNKLLIHNFTSRRILIIGKGPIGCKIARRRFGYLRVR